MTEGFELPDIGELLRQAQAMGQGSSHHPADEDDGVAGPGTAVVGTAAGGVVTVTLSSGADTQVGISASAVHIDPAAVDPGDPSLLEDLVMAAINDALSQVETDDSGAGGLAGMLGGLGGLSGLAESLPELLSSGLSGLGASLPDLLSGAMEALGLSGSGPSGSGPSGSGPGATTDDPTTDDPEPPAPAQTPV